MLEIEMKFRVDDFASVRAVLIEWNAAEDKAIDEADRYFNAPDRDFARTDEAFRLRSVGAANRVTYKGPKQGGPAKTRVEIEVGIEPGPDAAGRFGQLVQHLGYRPTAVVKKRRTVFHFERGGFGLQACLDEVETLGRYVEIEIMAEPADKERAQELLQALARELGLTASEPRSYLEMVLEKLPCRP